MHGPNWSHIASSYLAPRSALAIKNRFFCIIRKQNLQLKGGELVDSRGEAPGSSGADTDSPHMEDVEDSNTTNSSEVPTAVMRNMTDQSSSCSNELAIDDLISPTYGSADHTMSLADNADWLEDVAFDVPKPPENGANAWSLPQPSASMTGVNDISDVQQLYDSLERTVQGGEMPSFLPPQTSQQRPAQNRSNGEGVDRLRQITIHATCTDDQLSHLMQAAVSHSTSWNMTSS